MASGHNCKEIPFRLSSSTKWISGIAEDTTCRDILVAVLRAENLLDCEEDIVHHHYALVETWRWGFLKYKSSYPHSIALFRKYFQPTVEFFTVL